MNMHDKALRLIEKVTWQTAQEKLNWKFDSAPTQLTDGTGDKIDVYLSCEFRGQTLAVFEKKYKFYLDVDDWSWSSKKVFAIIDSAGRIIYESDKPDVKINNLYDLVFNSVANVEGIMNLLLSDD